MSQSLSSRLVVSFACATALWGCGSNAHDAVSGTQASAQAPQAAAKPGTPAQNLVNAYIALQSKLAKDDATGSKAAFVSLQNALNAKELALDPALAQKLSAAAAQGAASSKIDQARTAFAAVTEGLLTYFGAAKNPLNTSLTVAHCPMALDNKGANWLQLGETLENPYFGAEMSRCGTVEKKIQPGATL